MVDNLSGLTMLVMLYLDDISQNFTGIGKTFTLTEDGNNTTGITSDFGAILINNIFQKPEVDYNFLSSPSPGITSVRFTGNEALALQRYCQMMM